MRADAASTQPRPSTDTVVSITVKLWNMSFRDMPKLSLTCQEAALLRWGKMIEPQPRARTTSAGCSPGLSATMGATMPDAVMMATVAEPTESRIRAAITQRSEEH